MPCSGFLHPHIHAKKRQRLDRPSPPTLPSLLPTPLLRSCLLTALQALTFFNLPALLLFPSTLTLQTLHRLTLMKEKGTIAFLLSSTLPNLSQPEPVSFFLPLPLSQFWMSPHHPFPFVFQTHQKDPGQMKNITEKLQNTGPLLSTLTTPTILSLGLIIQQVQLASF